MKTGFTIALMISTLVSQACDICGTYLSLYPQDRRNSVSLLYKSRIMEGTVLMPYSGPKHGTLDALEGNYLELYNTLELRANLFLSERVSIMGVIPMVNRYRSVDRTRIADTYGFGGIFLMTGHLVRRHPGDLRFQDHLKTIIQSALGEERAGTIPPNRTRVIAGLSYFLINNALEQ